MFPVWTCRLYCTLALPGSSTQVSGSSTVHDNGSDKLVKLVAGLELGQSDPAQSILPSDRLESTSVDMGTQTDLITVHRRIPVVNFLENSECILEPAGIPNCYRYVPAVQFLWSPKIPVVIQGVRVPILLDTGAEISIVSTQFVQDLFPNVELSRRFRAVGNLGGGLVPIELTVEVCGVMLEHPFFYDEGNPTFLMGIDLLTRAVLTIDCELRCTWSKHMLRCHLHQDLANAAIRPTLHVNTDQFFDTVPPVPSMLSDAEPEESQQSAVVDDALTQLSMAPVFPLPQSVPVPFVRSDAIDVGIQCCESPAVTPFRFPSPSAPCMFCPSDTICCEDPLCSDASEVPLTCSVLNLQVPLSVSHFEVGPSHVPLSAVQSDPVVTSQVVSEPRLSDSSSFCQETSLLPFTRDNDEDVTLLKSHFDPGGSEIPVKVRESNVEGTSLTPTVDGLPEHVTQLFLDTFQQADFPIEATND